MASHYLHNKKKSFPCIFRKILFRKLVKPLILCAKLADKSKKEIDEEVTTKDEWEVLVFFTGSDEGSMVGTSKGFKSSGENIFRVR